MNLGVFVTILPLVLQAVKEVEDLFEDGAEKKKEAIDIVRALLAFPFVNVNVTEEVLEGIGDIIDGVVSIFNAKGVFKTTKKGENKKEKGKK